ncbi:MAG TPA: response regulator, partial [Symbiobacteriaceae bacterium]|nr:response regulator [Symbiobacteriaceae bacterium]
MALKLLIAEDEELERRALCRFVKDIEEVEVVAEARNGLEAVQLAALTHPDLALIDIKMPGLSGLRVIKEISAFCPAMKAIIITAYEDFDFAHEALRLGAMDYLLKPSPKEDVQAAVRRAADAVRREQARQRVEEQLKATAPSVLTALVLDLISGAQLAPQNLAERASLAGLSRLPTVALAVGVDPPASPDREGDWQEQRKRVHGIVSRTCVERLCCVAIPTGAEDLAVIFGTDGDDEAESLRLAEQLRSAVAAATGITVTVGVGRPAAEPGLLSESYKSALAAVRLGRLIHGTDRVIHADQLARPASAHAPALLELEQELEERVRWGDSPAAAVAADRLLQAYLGSSGLSPEGLRIRLLELAVVLSRAVGEAGVDRQAGT